MEEVEEEDCSSFPVRINHNHEKPSSYNVLTIELSKCKNIDDKKPEDFTTEYIYIHYNARFYKDVNEALDDYLSKGDGGSSSTSKDNLFLEMTKDLGGIFSLFTVFWISVKNTLFGKYATIVFFGFIIVLTLNSIRRH